MAWYAWRMLADSRQAGSLVMKALVFPEWWLYVPVPICFALLSLECARRVWRPSGLVEEASGASGVAAAQEERT
jgi:TRAP-type C4-dicarboxylate transport system permease small subunit